MAIATIAESSQRFDLKTVENGYVVIRRMTFGEKLQRQDDMLKMKTGSGSELEFTMLNKKTALTDFGNLVIDHNLTDVNERKLNFKNAQDVLALDPRVGDEISTYIDQINAYEETKEVKN